MIIFNATGSLLVVFDWHRYFSFSVSYDGGPKHGVKTAFRRQQFKYKDRSRKKKTPSSEEGKQAMYQQHAVDIIWEMRSICTAAITAYCQSAVRDDVTQIFENITLTT